MLSSFYGDTDSHASDVGHWLGMTPLRGVSLPPSAQSADTSLAEGGCMPRRCRGIRGDVGIAPYERTIGAFL